MSTICIFFGNFISREPLVLLLMCCGAVDAIDNIRFTSMKSIDGDDVCAVGISPVMSIGTRSEIQCSNECSESRSPTKCIGFNYKKSSQTCDIFDNDQMELVVQSGCKYYEKWRETTQTSVDVAVNKTSFQRANVLPYYAKFANDGDVVTRACTKSSLETPWWAVDLGNPMFIRALKVTNAGDSFDPTSLLNFGTWLSNTPPSVGQDLNFDLCSLCHQLQGGVASGDTAHVNCNQTMPAYRYVIILGNAVVMCLTDVQVFVAEN